MNDYMNKAVELSRNNFKKGYGGPFGACIVKDGVIISLGSNMVLKSNDPTAHAEVVAIRNACSKLNTYDLSGCELYTSCYPCPMCLAAIIWSNIKVVYYANSKEDASNIGFRDDFIYDYIDKLSKGESDDNTLKLERMNIDDAIKVFEEFSADKDKIIY